MTTTVPRIAPSLENLNSVPTLSSALINLGYPVLSTDPAHNSISLVIEVSGQRYPTLIDINDDGTAARIEVKIASAGDLPEDSQLLAAAALGLLSLNASIAPFAVAVHAPEHESDSNGEDAPITLVNEIPLGDLSTGELESAMMSCRRAIMLTTQNIAAFKSKASCGSGCGCHEVAASGVAASYRH